jgi:beta-fructofuranosidase
MKKITRIVTLQILFILGIVANNFAQKEKGLVGYWKFDEANGKLAYEALTNSADSIYSVFTNVRPAVEPLRRKGIVNKALVFDGFSNFIQRPADHFTTPTKAITVSVWVAPRAFENGDSGRLSSMVNQQNLAEKKGFALGMFRHGKWSFQLGTGKKWIEIWDEGNAIPRREWSYLTATYDAATGTAILYLNGKAVSKKILFQNLPIAPASEPLLIGKNNQPVLLNPRSRISLNMFNGFMDDLKIYDRVLTPLEIASSFQSYLSTHGKSIPSITYEEIKIDRAQYKDDPNRPQFHPIPPGHWMNEPHAPFYYNGKYHLTYQHNPTGPYWHQIHWGHWVSDDLVHWKDVPEAIFPEDNGVAPDGIWSGSATVDEKGKPVLVYTYGDWSKVKNQGVALAFAKDPLDPNLTEWVPDTKPLIIQADNQGLIGEMRDPFAWKDKEDNKWYMLVGSGVKDKGGTAWFYESDDFKQWKLKGPFYMSNYEKYPFLGSIWELPVFLPLGKYPNGETKYVMIVSPKGLNQNVEVYYWLGRFDKQNSRFIPDDEEPQYWDYGVRRFIGPSGMIDPKTGRALIFTITAGGNGPGWSGNASFPTHIFLNEKGNLGVKPIDELQTLRKKELLSLSNETLVSANQKLSDVKGDMLEIILDIESGADTFGIQIRRSPDEREKTLIMYDAKNKKLKADLSKTSVNSRNNNFQGGGFQGTDKRTERIGHFDLQGESFKLHIFIDKALVQTYANDLKSITSWAYPTLAESKGLNIWSSNGQAKIKSMKVYEMQSIYY